MAKRYCGKCGQQLSKKKTKAVCSDCDIKWEEFKEPHNKWRIGMIVNLLILYFATAFFGIVYVFELSHKDARLSILFLITLSLITAMFYTSTIPKIVKKGLITCKFCKNISSLKAKYCIYCGKRISWVQEPKLLQYLNNPFRLFHRR